MLNLVLWFSLLSLLSIGGISSIMPEFQRVVVQTNHWVTPAEFTQLFAVSQAAPGPNVLISSLIGFKVAGFFGAVVALFAMTLPAAVVAWHVAVVWDRFKDAPWRAAIQRALLPVTVGLVFAGGYVLGTPAGLDWRSVLIAGLSAGTLYFTRRNPLWILAGGGVLGYFIF